MPFNTVQASWGIKYLHSLIFLVEKFGHILSVNVLEWGFAYCIPVTTMLYL